MPPGRDRVMQILGRARSAARRLLLPRRSVYVLRGSLGDLLMELGRPEEALLAYQASLGAWPGRFNSLLGAARASRAAGDARGASRYYAELLAVVGEAETRRPGVREALQYVADSE